MKSSVINPIYFVKLCMLNFGEMASVQIECTMFASRRRE